PLNARIRGTLATDAPERSNIRLDDRVALDTTGAAFTLTAGRRIVQLEPLLTFNQRSPDGSWTIFAPRGQRVPIERNLVATTREEAGVKTAYSEAGTEPDAAPQYHLSVRRSNEEDYEIMAISDVQRETWSHLNTFTQLTVAG